MRQLLFCSAFCVVLALTSAIGSSNIRIRFLGHSIADRAILAISVPIKSTVAGTANVSTVASATRTKLHIATKTQSLQIALKLRRSSDPTLPSDRSCSSSLELLTGIGAGNSSCTRFSKADLLAAPRLCSGLPDRQLVPNPTGGFCYSSRRQLCSARLKLCKSI